MAKTLEFDIASPEDFQLPKDYSPNIADSATKKEEEYLKNISIKLDLFGKQQDIQSRKKYAKRIFRLICFWLTGIFVIILFQGFSIFFKFNLQPSVMLALIGGTTINVLGLFVIVIQYIFPKKYLLN